MSPLSSDPRRAPDIQFASWLNSYTNVFEEDVSPNDLGLRGIHSALYRFLLLKRRFFSPYTLWIALHVALALLSLKYRLAVVGLLSFGVFTLYLLNQAKSRAHDLRLDFSCPDRIAENQELLIDYKIFSQGGHPLSDILLLETFSGSDSAEQVKALSGKTNEPSTRAFQSRRKADGGMGPHAVGPIKALVSDDFGIFKYHITFKQSAAVKVTPLVIPTPRVSLVPNAHSIRFGVLEVQTVGHSINFSGIRPYSIGDSRRLIAWKATARYQRLLVKEFERSTNAEVCIVLDRQAALHVGRGARSTMEHAKDFALGLLSRELRAQSDVHFLSHDVYIPPGSGVEHLAYISKKIEPLTIFNAPADSDHTLDFWLKQARPHTSLVYIFPILKPNIRQTLEALKRCIQFGLSVSVIAIRAETFVDPDFFKAYPIIQSIFWNVNAHTHWKNVLEELKALDCAIYVLNAGMKLEPINRELPRET